MQLLKICDILKKKYWSQNQEKTLRRLSVNPWNRQKSGLSFSDLRMKVTLSKMDQKTKKQRIFKSWFSDNLDQI